MKPFMSNQTIHRLLGIFADDGCLAQRMVFVQDELGTFKPFAVDRLRCTARAITIVHPKGDNHTGGFSHLRYSLVGGL